MTLGKRQHMDEKEMERITVETFGTTIPELSKAQASQLIGMLTE
jgi:hypothetical protein